MSDATRETSITRRALVYRIGLGAAVLAFAPPATATATDAPMAEILTLTGGRMPVASDRLLLDMPRVFANGFTVPMTITVESPMSETDHVRQVHVLAPGNPFLKVASFHFTPDSGEARVSTRIRLAQPQHIYALAELSDGSFLLAETWVEVKTNGCAG